MKKFAAVVLAIAMMFCMAACDKDRDIRGSHEETTDAPDKSFDVGSVQSNKYVNKFVGISCELGSEWTYLTDEQIRENNETTLGLIGDDYAELIQSADTFTDMMATHQNQTDTVNITFEKLKGANALLSVDRYIELSLDSMKDALSSIGLKNLQTSIGTMTFAGQEQQYVEISGTYFGISMYEQMVVVKCEGYMVLITVCTWQTNTCSDILAKFQAE